MSIRNPLPTKCLTAIACLGLTLSIVLTPARYAFALACSELFHPVNEIKTPASNQNDILDLGKNYRLELFEVNSANPVFKVYEIDTQQLIGIFKLPENPKPISALRHFIFLRGKAEIEKDGLAGRSAFAYRLAQLVKFERVPYTKKALADGYGSGSYIHFLRNYKLAYEIYRDSPHNFKMIDAAEAQKFLLFDLLLQAQDRSTFNWMIDENGNIGLIDNDRILLNTNRPNWFVRLNLKKVLPQARGVLLPEAVKMIEQLSDKNFSDLLNEFNFPEEVVTLARKRLQLLKEKIALNSTMEELYELTPPGYIRLRFLGNELLLRYKI